MSRKLAYPRLDADGRVIEPWRLNIPVVRPAPLVRCLVCGAEGEPSIVAGICDTCVLAQWPGVDDAKGGGE